MQQTLRPFISAAALALLLGVPFALTQASAAVYSYVKLADADDGFTSFDPPALLSNGVATWKAADTEGKDGIYAGDGTFLDTVLAPGGALEFVGSPSGYANDIVYPAGQDDELQEVYFFQLGDPFPQLLLATNGRISGLKMNKFQTVAYRSDWLPGIPAAGIVANHPLLGDWVIAAFAGSFSDAVLGALDDADCVAYTSFFDRNLPPITFPLYQRTAVMRACRGLPRSVVAEDDDGSGSSPFVSVGSPSMAGSAGGVVFRGSYFEGLLLPSDEALLLSFLGSSVEIVDDDGPFDGLGPPSHNAVGVTAFRATLDGGGDGIYIGPDPVADRVIEAGDGLFGKGVIEVRIGERALGKLGSIAFWAMLEDGSEGVFRADPVAFPPEGVWERIELPSTEENMTLDASGSTADPEEPIVEYAWDLDFDGTFDVVTPASVTEVSPALYLTLLQPGENPVLLRVATAAGAYSTHPDVIALPTACSNGVDDDGDGKIDAGQDAGCRDPYKDFSEEPDCSDGLDNDGDGFTDRIGEDPGCQTPSSPIENPQCNNGYDDDGDLLIDLEEGFGDPDCLTPWQNFERVEQLPALSLYGAAGLALCLAVAAGVAGAARRRASRGT